MFSKEEIIERKKVFWEAFETRMKKHRSAFNGNKINWSHYRTNMPHIYFRLETNSNDVKLCIDLQHKNEGIRELIYEQFIEVRKVMNSYFENELEFVKHQKHNNGLYVSRIFTSLENVNYLSDNDQKKILDFFEKNLLALDDFWSEYRDLFLQLK